MILRSTLCLDMQRKYNEICEIFNVVMNRDFGHICFIVGLGTRETALSNDLESHHKSKCKRWLDNDKQ